MNGALFKNFSSRASQDYAIDLGSSNTLLYLKGKGLIAREASYVAFSGKTPLHQNIIAHGSRARDLLGKTSSNVTSRSPIIAGRICDMHLAQALLQHLIGKLSPLNRMFQGKAIVGIPVGLNEVERRTVVQVLESAGIGKVFLIDQVMAGAIGAGVPLSATCGSLVVDFGGGRTDAAVVSPDGIVVSRSVKIGGNTIDSSIIDYVRREYAVLIGEQSAELAKLTVGAARPTPNSPQTIRLTGHDLVASHPTEVTISQTDVLEAMRTPLMAIVECIKSVLEETPPELSADLIDAGIVLFGGGSLIRDLDLFLSEELELPVTLVEDPLTTVVTGSGKVLEEWREYQHLLYVV